MSVFRVYFCSPSGASAPMEKLPYREFQSFEETAKACVRFPGALHVAKVDARTGIPIKPVTSESSQQAHSM